MVLKERCGEVNKELGSRNLLLGVSSYQNLSRLRLSQYHEIRILELWN